MRNAKTLIAGACALLWAGAAAQFGRADWMSGGGDAQRSYWVRTDAKVSASSLQSSGFRLLWKVDLPAQSPSKLVSPVVLLDRYIGYRGFRSLGFVGVGSGDVYAVDTDLARIEWKKRFPVGAQAQSNCGDSFIAVTRPTTAAFPSAMMGFGRGRGTPARSGVGKAGEGAVTLGQAPMVRPATPPRRTSPRNAPARRPAPSPFAPHVTAVNTITRDGMLHTMYVSNGHEPGPPVKFLPPNANAEGLIIVDDVAYVTTTHGCGGVPNGVWALDLDSKKVSSWEAGGDVAGTAGPAFGPDGTLYVTARDGKLSVLEAGTLRLKDWYTAGEEFTSSPVVFAAGEKTFVAAVTKDGTIHLLDASGLGGASHNVPLYKTTAYAKSAHFVPDALAVWQDAAGMNWLLASAAGPVSAGAGFMASNGTVKNGAVAAWKVTERAGSASLLPAWLSRDIAPGIAPMIMNGVVFALSSGDSPAVLYAFDGLTGNEIWNSGKAIAAPVRRGEISGGGSQVYVGTSNGALYAFGVPMDR